MFNQRTNGIEYSRIRVYSALASKLPDAIDLTLGEPDFVTPSHICKAAKEAVDKGFTHYTPTAGVPDLREAIAEKLSRDNGIVADSNSEILVTVGATEGIALTMQVLLNEGDEVLVPDPGFDMYIPNILLAGGRPVPVPLAKPDFILDTEQLEQMITDKTRMILLNSPNNPTGSAYGLSDLRDILDIAIRHDLLIFSDEAYEAIVYDGHKHYSIGSLPEAFSRCITVYSFSKTYAMTGWRVGYIVASRAIISQMMKLHRNIVAHPSSIAQMAALAALTGPQGSVKEMVQEFDRRRIFLIRSLEELGIPCPRPKGAFYLFPCVSHFGRSSDTVAKALATEARVITVPGSAFGSCGENYLRLSYAASNQKLVQAVDRIAEWSKNKVSQ